MKTILLFDMDGVLLTPGGYHRALQDTVAYLGRSLGFPEAAISQEQIHAFEAAGITNEWDSAAICLAVLVDALWEAAPDQPVGPELLMEPLRMNGRPAPDFDRVLLRLAVETSRSDDPIRRAQAVLPERVHGIVAQAYMPIGLSHRVQQEHVLGSQAFREAYGIPGLLGVESYLLLYDRNNLDGDEAARLAGWLKRGGEAAIFTNRPTRSPDGRLGTPEGELGRRLVGLDSLPLAGSGGIVWLEGRYGVAAGTYNKPHPLHALAALRMALGEGAPDAFLSAHALVVGEGDPEAWKRLQGAEVWLFEDSTAGTDSLRIAKDILGLRGIEIIARPVGVTENPLKARALKESGAQVYPSLSAALRSFFESRGL